MYGVCASNNVNLTKVNLNCIRYPLMETYTIYLMAVIRLSTCVKVWKSDMIFLKKRLMSAGQNMTESPDNFVKNEVL